MADPNCSICNTVIIANYKCDGTAVVLYLATKCHLSCVLKHIFKKHKGYPPDKVTK